jgi:hypothetical protein
MYLSGHWTLRLLDAKKEDGSLNLTKSVRNACVVCVVLKVCTSASRLGISFD